MGVATVGLVYAAVRRRFSPAAGLIAGAVLALTPVAALMFRFNNPDALLALLMVAGRYLVVRALEDGRTRWLVAAGVAIGLALPHQDAPGVPGPAGLRRWSTLVARPGRWRGGSANWPPPPRDAGRPAGWWVAIVELWPAPTARTSAVRRQQLPGPDLRLQRLRPDQRQRDRQRGGGGRARRQPGATGWGRMFSTEIGGQISWLLPAALILGRGLVATRRRAHADPRLVPGLGRLLMPWRSSASWRAIFHQYYTVALAPALAAVVGMGAVELWRGRRPVDGSLPGAAPRRNPAAHGPGRRSCCLRALLSFGSPPRCPVWLVPSAARSRCRSAWCSCPGWTDGSPWWPP